MTDAVGEPGKKVEDRMGVGRENIRNVGAVEDVLQSRKDFDPNVWSILNGNEAAKGFISFSRVTSSDGER